MKRRRRGAGGGRDERRRHRVRVLRFERRGGGGECREVEGVEDGPCAGNEEVELVQVHGECATERDGSVAFYINARREVEERERESRIVSRKGGRKKRGERKREYGATWEEVINTGTLRNVWANGRPPRGPTEPEEKKRRWQGDVRPQ